VHVEEWASGPVLSEGSLQLLQESPAPGRQSHTKPDVTWEQMCSPPGESRPARDERFASSVMSSGNMQVSQQHLLSASDKNQRLGTGHHGFLEVFSVLRTQVLFYSKKEQREVLI
jgi:hypothetical protein